MKNFKIFAYFLLVSLFFLSVPKNVSAASGDWWLTLAAEVSDAVVEKPVAVEAMPNEAEESGRSPEILSEVRVNSEEPYIMVGLFKTKDPVKFVSLFKYGVYAEDELKGTLPADETAVLEYKKGKYYFQSASLKFNSDKFIRLVPAEPSTYFTLPDSIRKVTANSKQNYSTYRGEMIYRYSPKSALPYIINNVLLEYYVAGIGEAADSSPLEFLKALLVAARSYGYVNIASVHTEKNLFDVYGSTVDQLYLGYTLETSRPNVLKAAAATYGQMVFYDDVPVITPYFGRSNGKTKTWKQVWGGQDKAWIASVECAYDKGKQQWGHGVGMSTQDATQRAKKDGWTYDQILNHYYPGTWTERLY